MKCTVKTDNRLIGVNIFSYTFKGKDRTAMWDKSVNVKLILKSLKEMGAENISYQTYS